MIKLKNPRRFDAVPSGHGYLQQMPQLKLACLHDQLQVLREWNAVQMLAAWGKPLLVRFEWAAFRLVTHFAFEAKAGARGPIVAAQGEVL